MPTALLLLHRGTLGVLVPEGRALLKADEGREVGCCALEFGECTRQVYKPDF